MFSGIKSTKLQFLQETTKQIWEFLLSISWKVAKAVAWSSVIVYSSSYASCMAEISTWRSLLSSQGVIREFRDLGMFDLLWECSLWSQTRQFKRSIRLSSFKEFSDVSDLFRRSNINSRQPWFSQAIRTFEGSFFYGKNLWTYPILQIGHTATWLPPP